MSSDEVKATLISLLEQALESDEGFRTQAEAALEARLVPTSSDFPDTVRTLIGLAPPEVSVAVHGLALSMVRKALSSKNEAVLSHWGKFSAEWRSSLRPILVNHPQLADAILSLDVHALNDQSFLTSLVDPLMEENLDLNGVEALLACLTGFCNREKASLITLVDGNRILTLLVRLISSPLMTSDPDIAESIGNAMTALMPYISHNMAVPVESRVIMEAIARIRVHSVPRVRAAGLKTLIAIVENYYDILYSYMPSIFSQHAVILMQAANGPDTLAVLQFWSALAVFELQNSDSKKHVSRAADHLLRIILPLISKRSSDDDGQLKTDSSSSSSSSSSTSSSSSEEKEVPDQRLMAILFLKDMVEVSPAVVPKAIRYAFGNLRNSDWKLRAAACDIYGAAAFARLDLPIQQNMIKFALSPEDPSKGLIALLKDPVPVVAESAAWAIRQAASLYNLADESAVKLLEAVLKSLQSAQTLNPKVIGWLCLTIAVLCEHFQLDASPETSPITQFAPRIAEMGMILLHQIPSARPAITEMIISLIRSSPQDCLSMMHRLLDMYGQAVYSVTKASNPGAVDPWPLSPSLSCIAAIFQTHSASFAAPKFSKAALNLVSSTFSFLANYEPSSSSQSNALESLEDAAIVLQVSFPSIPAENRSEALTAVVPHILRCLSSALNPSVTSVLFEALASLVSFAEIDPFTDQIASVACRILSVKALPATPASHVINLLTDLALSLGEKYAKFLPVTSKLVAHRLAICAHLDEEDPDEVVAKDLLITAACQAISAFAITSKQPPDAQTVQGLQATAFWLVNLARNDPHDAPFFATSVRALLEAIRDLVVESRWTTDSTLWNSLFKLRSVFELASLPELASVLKTLPSKDAEDPALPTE